MRILQVVDYFKPMWSGGGQSRVAYEVSSRLVKEGHDVTVYCNGERKDATVEAKKNQPIDVDGITVYYLKNISRYLVAKTNIDTPYFLPILARRNLKDFDIVHFHTYRSMIVVPVWYYAMKYGTPYVLQAHGSAATYFLKGRLKRIFDDLWGYRILNNASKLFAVTRMEAQQYLDMGTSKDNIEIVPNGISLYEYKELPQKGTFKKKYSIDNSAKIVLYLGRIHKIKGIDYLAKAFAELRKNLPETKLVIAGPDDGYLPTLTKLIHDLGIQNDVIFTGPLWEADKIEAYVDADVYVLPSTYEIFGVTLLEAWACGTPVITTDQCGLAAVVADQAGLVVPCDTSSLREALSRILTDEECLKRFGENGRSLVHSQFDWERITKQIEDIYTRACSH